MEVTIKVTIKVTMAQKRKKSYDISFKLKAVESAEKKSKEVAAREFGVDAKRFWKWCSQQDQLVAMKQSNKSKRSRLAGGGRKVTDKDMEEALLSWIQDLHSCNLQVSHKMIRAQAKELTTTTNFTVSRGWLERFMKRKDSLCVERLLCAKLRQPTASQNLWVLLCMYEASRFSTNIDKTLYSPWMRRHAGLICHQIPLFTLQAHVQTLWRQQDMTKTTTLSFCLLEQKVPSVSLTWYSRAKVRAWLKISNRYQVLSFTSFQMGGWTTL